MLDEKELIAATEASQNVLAPNLYNDSYRNISGQECAWNSWFDMYQMSVKLADEP